MGVFPQRLVVRRHGVQNFSVQLHYQLRLSQLPSDPLQSLQSLKVELIQDFEAVDIGPSSNTTIRRHRRWERRGLWPICYRSSNNVRHASVPSVSKRLGLES